MRALCVPHGAPQPLQKELGPSGTGLRRTVRDKFDTLAGLLPFFLAMLGALQAKKGNKPAKVSNLSLTVLLRPVPHGPNSFCSGCGAPWGTHNALTTARTPHWQISTLQMPSVSSAEVFTLRTGVQLFTLDSSKMEVFKTYFFILRPPKMTIQGT